MNVLFKWLVCIAHLHITHCTMSYSMWMRLLVKISIYHTFIASLLKTIIFLNEIFKLITSFKLCEMTWFTIHSTFIKIKNHLNYFWNIFVFLSTRWMQSMVVHFWCHNGVFCWVPLVQRHTLSIIFKNILIGSWM
jgi:hypothetical protein